MTESLYSPLKMGSLNLKNRIVMAPLTRCRASGQDGRTPNDLMVEYYTQRASAGLIITEATSVCEMGVGYPNTPGIWNSDHIAGWKKITDAVHKQNGLIVLQLWHVGRVSDAEYLKGQMPVAPSAIPLSGHVKLLRPLRPYPIPRALKLEEIKDIVSSYRHAALNAKEAGFDGVEIHGANGYLLDQFLQDSTNHRTDDYGGSLENRAKLMLEVTDACIEVWGSDRVGMHLAPRCDSHDMGDSNPFATFCHIANELNKRNIAFICTRESTAHDSITPHLKKIFSGAIIANENFTKRSAEAAIESQSADAIAFGKLFIANPDLPYRLKHQLALNEPLQETFYSPGQKGYTDYPFAS